MTTYDSNWQNRKEGPGAQRKIKFENETTDWYIINPHRQTQMKVGLTVSAGTAYVESTAALDSDIIANAIADINALTWDQGEVAAGETRQGKMDLPVSAIRVVAPAGTGQLNIVI